MTPAQLHDARMLIPGAFELNAPPQRAARVPGVLPAASSQNVPVSPSLASTSQVSAAPTRPTTRLGHAAAILGDIALLVGIVYAIAVPALALWGIQAVAAFVESFGRH